MTVKRNLRFGAALIAGAAALTLASPSAFAQEREREGGSRVRYQASTDRAVDNFEEHFHVTATPKKQTTVISRSQVVTETPVAAKTEEVIPQVEASPEPVAVAEAAPEPAPAPEKPAELPTTASPFPAAAVSGLGALFAALSMTRRRRRAW